MGKACRLGQLHRLVKAKAQLGGVVTVGVEDDLPAKLLETAQQGSTGIGGGAVAPGDGPGVHLKGYPLLYQVLHNLQRPTEIPGAVLIDGVDLLVELGDQVKVADPLAPRLSGQVGHQVVVGIGIAIPIAAEALIHRPLAVLGAGIMGGGIAYQSAWKGVPVVMKDISDKSLTLGMTEAAKLLNKQLERGKIDGLKLAGVISTIQPTLEYSGFDRVDVVVEAVVENPKVKKAVLAETEAKVRPDTVLASNTSTIPISELASVLQLPENFCGMHFFNPVHRMPLVEVIRGEKTSDKTIAKVVAWASKMGKTPIVVNDCPGFFVNRVLFPYFAGFSQLLRDGADFRKVDKVMEKQFGWPMGPAYLLDVVGIDTAHHAQAVMAAGFPQRMQKDYRDAIDALFDANRFGQKNGLGFWRYKEDSKGKPKKEEDAAVDSLLADVSQPKRDFSDEEIIARMMIPMVNEVVRCLEEGIIASPAEADMALVYGLGFPPFHGGAFRWLDTIGSAKYLDMAQQYQHLGPLYEVPAGLRDKARHNEAYYPQVKPARPVGALKTA